MFCRSICSGHVLRESPMSRADIASPSLLSSAGVPDVAELILSPVANLLESAGAHLAYNLL